MGLPGRPHPRGGRRAPAPGRQRLCPGRTRTGPGKHGPNPPSPRGQGVPVPPPQPPGPGRGAAPAAPPGNAGTVSALLPLSSPHPSLSLPADGRAGYDPCVPRGDARVGRRWPRAGAGGDKGLRAGTGGLPGHSGHLAEFRSYLQEFADVDQAMGRGRLRRENPRSASGDSLAGKPTCLVHSLMGTRVWMRDFAFCFSISAKARFGFFPN